MLVSPEDVVIVQGSGVEGCLFGQFSPFETRNKIDCERHLVLDRLYNEDQLRNICHVQIDRSWLKSTDWKQMHAVAFVY